MSGMLIFIHFLRKLVLCMTIRGAFLQNARRMFTVLPTKESSMRRFLLSLVLLCVFLGCSPGESRDQSRLAELEKSIASLSDQVQGMQSRIEERMADFDRQLDDLRTDLKNILQYLNLSLENLEQASRGEDGTLSESAREKIRENVDRLLDLSDKVLDRLEEQLEQGLEQKEPGTPPEKMQ
jgi:septal ring factor EnvC (AmiA/AmiB activator)